MKKKKVLIATDGSETSAAAINEACEYIDPQITDVLVVSAYQPQFHLTTEPGFALTEYYADMESDLKLAGNKCLQTAEDEIRNHFASVDVSVKTKLLTGPAGEAIVKKARTWHADLLVVGSHGYGFWDRMLGSVSDDVVHHAPCSVLVARR